MAYWVWGAWIVAGAVGLASLAAALGATYQVVGERADLESHPPPGRLVDVNGRRLHLYCTGKGHGPAVVIEAGAGNDSTLWADIVQRVSSFAKACTYDRAGLGWSDPVPHPMTFEDRANDLHSLLAATDLTGPIVLVGHSYGGYIVRAFTRLYPQQVAGIVLVESAEEGYTFDPWGLKYAAEVRARERRTMWAARLGLLRFCVKLFPAYCDPVKGVPLNARDEMTALYLRTSRHFAAADEMTALEKVPQAMRNPGGFGTLRDVPLIVISRGSRDPTTNGPTQPEWLAGQRRLLGLSSRAIHVVAKESGHMVQFSEPQVIVEAISQWRE
jgi:pimeloyl-ACP methyl ester carboxylesterase